MADYFRAAVLYAEGETEKIRQAAWRQMVAIREFRRNVSTDVELLTGMMADWVRMAVYELARSPDFSDDPEWVSSRMRFGVEPEHSGEAVAWLRARGLLGPDADGVIGATIERISTDTSAGRYDALSAATKKRHHDALELARAGLYVEPAFRHFGAITTAVSVAKRAEIIRRLQAFERELLRFVHEPDDDPRDVVVQVSTHVFPLTVEPGVR